MMKKKTLLLFLVFLWLLGGDQGNIGIIHATPSLYARGSALLTSYGVHMGMGVLGYVLTRVGAKVLLKPDIANYLAYRCGIASMLSSRYFLHNYMYDRALVVYARQRLSSQYIQQVYGAIKHYLQCLAIMYIIDERMHTPVTVSEDVKKIRVILDELMSVSHLSASDECMHLCSLLDGTTDKDIVVDMWGIRDIVYTPQTMQDMKIFLMLVSGFLYQDIMRLHAKARSLYRFEQCMESFLKYKL